MRFHSCRPAHPGMLYAMWSHRGPRGGRGPGPWGGDWGGRSGGGRRGRLFDSSDLKLMLLWLIETAPAHGYELIRQIEEKSGGAYVPSPGMVYPTLTLLEDMGLIEAQQTDGARKAYAITPEGRAHLAEQAAAVEALFKRLDELARQKNPGDSGSIRRAMANLGAAVANRMAQDDADRETLHAIAALIDEAAGKIERS